MNFQIFKLDLEKAEETEMKLQHPLDHRKIKQIPEIIYFSIIVYAKVFVWITKIGENSETDRNTKPPDLPPEKFVYRLRSNS